MGKALLLAVNIFCGLYGAYFAGVILLGALKRQRAPYPVAAPTKRIAAVVAARNEEAVIEGVVKTLLDQNYPRELFDVYVVPNGCKDDTERVAREAGARILPCDIPVRGKGDVLRFAFEELQKMEKYDAFCLFDADNIVDPGFLSASNNALCAGEKVAQGFRDSKNSGDSWVAGGMSMFYWFMSRLFNRGRAALNMSAMLNGTGVLLSADFVREADFQTRTLTEDLELTAQCGILGVKIGWMEDAVTYDEQPNSLMSSITQRRRWFAGGVQCMRHYGPALLKRAIRERCMQALDFGIFFYGNLMQVLAFVPGVASVVKTIQYALSKGRISIAVAGLCGAAVLFVAGCTLGAAGLCTLVKRPIRRELPGILGLWLIAVSWVPANLSALIVPPKWKAIPHVSRAGLPDIPRADKKPRTVPSRKASM